MNIILIGMRGSGKSTIGKVLSKKIGKSFYDLDTELEQKNEMSIAQMVKKYDWDYFRDRETEIVEEISKKNNAVIATGGGIILRQINITELKRNGKFIYLNTSIGEIVKRIGGGINRPALTKHNTLEEELIEVFEKRKKLYEQAADITIDTNHKFPKQVAEEILQMI